MAGGPVTAFNAGQRWSVDTSVFLNSYRRMYALESPTIPVVIFSGTTNTLALPSVAAESRSLRLFSWRRDSGYVAGDSHGWCLMPSYSYLHETCAFTADYHGHLLLGSRSFQNLDIRRSYGRSTVYPVPGSLT